MVIETPTFCGANTVTLKKDSYRYMELAKSIRMDGANTVVVMFSIAVRWCDKFQAGRFVKCVGEWDATNYQVLFGQQASHERSYF